MMNGYGSASDSSNGGGYFGMGKLSLGGIGKVLASAVETQMAATPSPTAAASTSPAIAGASGGGGGGGRSAETQRPPAAKRSPYAQSRQSKCHITSFIFLLYCNSWHCIALHCVTVLLYTYVPLFPLTIDYRRQILWHPLRRDLPVLPTAPRPPPPRRASA
jgi:hypothetical protein